MINSSANPAICLLKFNLHWHTQMMKEAIIRYKIFLLFLFLSLAPTVSGLEYILTLPTNYLISPQSSFFPYILSLIAYLSIGMAWFGLQKSILTNQPWDGFISSLPLSKIQKTISEALTIAVADYLIWVPLILAAYQAMMKPDNSFLDFVLIFERSITYAGLMILAQLSWKTNSFKILNLASVLSIFFYVPSLFVNKCLAVIVTLMILMLAIYLMTECYSLERSNALMKDKFVNDEEIKIKVVSSRLTFSLIQIKNYWEHYKPELIIPALLLLSMLAISFCLMKFSQDNPILREIISSLMLINALIMSNLFVKLNNQRQQISLYLSSLPLSKFNIFLSDFSVIAIGLLLVNLVLILTEIHVLKHELMIFQLAYTFIMPILFLAATYFPQLRFKKYGNLISLTLMSAFIWFNHLIFLVIK